MYKVSLNSKGIIEVVYKGALTLEEYARADKDVSLLLDIFPNREGLVQIDISKLTTNTSEGRRAAAASAKNMKNCRVAFITPNIINRALTTLLISSANRTELDKVFSNKEDASKWLESLREEFQK
ncbi:MAG: hypothetical protein ACMG57_02405 [Candidatus Dojkabacteria bacterium]